MKRQEIKKALIKIGYTHDSIKSLLCGRALPSMSKAITLKSEYGIPLEVWIDIKSYLKNSTKQETKESNTAQNEKVSA